MVYLLIRRTRYEDSDVVTASSDPEKLRSYMRDMMEDWNLETREYRPSAIEREIQESRAFEAETGFPPKSEAEIVEQWDHDHMMRERDGVLYQSDMTWEIVEMPLI
jgi:hypothetical protein